MSDSDPMLLKIMETLGALRADVQNLKDDQTIERQTGADFRREVRVEISGLKEDITEINHAIQPVAAAVEQHGATLKDHTTLITGFSLFQNRLGAIVALGGSSISIVFGGAYWFVSTYSAEIWAFIRSIFSKA
ncbi:hypothetical protein FHS55_002616 [Angulomicrobium tetraedrale]|uniref:Uncharacterized protein n=1 Tax=Ancylobacter tetraedralis TaxID=217068 RepID=A0A839ZBA2_9HYPH|nr:hypothetical protein [Ancylobacter tetraedralis]MBB3772007.1 hypothetical protein [Ancylobacter tetraedralis]